MGYFQIPHDLNNDYWWNQPSTTYPSGTVTIYYYPSSLSWKQCSKCLKWVDAQDRYCRHCGEQLFKTCPHCGKEI